MQPINRLPPETFSSIGRKVTGNSLDASASLFPLTHVCQRWRESLISIPENWSSISNWNDDIAAVCLQRAKAAPLEISLYKPSPPEPSLFPHIIEPYDQNIRTLNVGLDSASAVEQVTATFPSFPQSMPMLESLELESGGEEEDWSIDPFEPGFTLALKCLSLTSIPLYPSILRIRTLTELILCDPVGDLRFDTLLDFLENNNSLESVHLDIEFVEPPPRNLQRRITKNQLQYLSIWCKNDVEARALIITIPLRRGASLDINIQDQNATLIDTIPNVSTAHLLDPQSPSTFELITHRRCRVGVLLRGLGGEFSFFKPVRVEDSEPFPDLHQLPLTNIHEFRLLHFEEAERNVPEPPVFRPSLFPNLETLAIECNPECETDVRRVLSSLLSNPTSSSLLKTLAFLNCTLSEELVEEITNFASERKRTLTSTWLYRVLIVHQDGKFPSAASIHKLKNYVKVVEVRMGNELPEGLT